jgi:predicted RND superfamily exporter protein
MWRFLAEFILKNRLKLLFVIACITGYMTYQAFTVKIAYSWVQLLPANDSARMEYEAYQKQFGQDGLVMIAGRESDSLFSNLKEFDDWCRLDREIKHTEGIKDVISAASLYNLVVIKDSSKIRLVPVIKREPATMKELDSIKQVIYSLPFFDHTVINRQNNSTVMAITFKDKELNTRARIAIVDSVWEKMERFSKKYHIAMHYSGMPFIRTTISKKIMHEMTLFLYLTAFVTLLALFLFFRSLYAVVFPVIVVVVGVIWSVALINIFDFRITALTGIIAPLIMVIGIPNCILLLNKYHHEYRKEGDKIKALKEMVSKIGISIFFANVTTAIGFAVFCSTRSALLVQFGLVASLGVICTYLISLFLIPIIFSYLPPPKQKQTRHLQRKVLTSLLTKADHIVHHKRRIIYAVAIISVIVSVFGILKIKVLGYVVDGLPSKDAIYRDMKYFESKYGGVLPVEIKIDTRKPNGVFAGNAATLYKMERLERMLRQYPFFSHPLSILEGIKFANQAFHDGNPKYFITPTLNDLQSINKDVPQTGQKLSIIKAFLDSAKQCTSINMVMADLGSEKMKEELAILIPRTDSIFNYSAATHTWLPEAERYKVTYTGSCLIFLKGNDYMVKNLIESVFLAVILVSLVMFLMFMSVRMVVIATVPTLIPLIITLGLMGFFDVRLNPYTILIFSIAFGISSDGTMYFLTKYKQDLKKLNLSTSELISLVIKETGISMIYTAIILSCGFLVFIFSGFEGTRTIGILISVTLLMAYSSNLILLPSFILSLEKSILKKQDLKDSLIEIPELENDDAENGIA